jgi:hypothetical protein
LITLGIAAIGFSAFTLMARYLPIFEIEHHDDSTAVPSIYDVVTDAQMVSRPD